MTKKFQNMPKINQKYTQGKVHKSRPWVYFRLIPRLFHYKVSKKRRNPSKLTDLVKEETKTSQQDANISAVLGSPVEV